MQHIKIILGYAALTLCGFFVASFAVAQDNDESSSIEDGALETIYLEKQISIEDRQLEEVEDYLNSIRSVKARFAQQNPDGRLVYGKLNMERPGRIRFEYDDDIPLLIVSDGETLNLIDYDVNQITKWPINDTPLALIVAEESQFDENAYIVTQGPAEVANMVAVTTRDPRKPTQGSLTLIFSSEADESDRSLGALTLRAWQVIDAQGTLTTVSISEIEKNIALDPALWTFTDPRGEGFSRRRRSR